MHFTKGETLADAFITFQKIVNQQRLVGGNGFIKGGYRCVCFSEAPLPYLADVFRREQGFTVRYQPFGVLVPKAWLFNLGARPVIYQSESEFDLLPESIRYRHVRYEPAADRPIDFTWEREWRLHSDALDLNHHACGLVLPSQAYLSALKQAYEQDQFNDWMRIFDQISAWQMVEAFRWRVVVLDELVPP